MKKYLKYLGYILKHKYYVFIECCKLGIPLQGITHDLSKFSFQEFISYANYNFKGENTDYQKKSFQYGWLHHQKMNPHHWEYWVQPDYNEDYSIQSHGDGYIPYWFAKKDILDPNENQKIYIEKDHKDFSSYCDIINEFKDKINHYPKCLKIPYKYILEMIADWNAMSKTMGGTTKEFYNKNKHRMMFHPESRITLENILGDKR